jgi:hypothetical protein
VSKLEDLNTEAIIREIIPNQQIFGAGLATQAIWKWFSRLEDGARRDSSE